MKKLGLSWLSDIAWSRKRWSISGRLQCHHTHLSSPIVLDKEYQWVRFRSLEGVYCFCWVSSTSASRYFFAKTALLSSIMVKERAKTFSQCRTSWTIHRISALPLSILSAKFNLCSHNTSPIAHWLSIIKPLTWSTITVREGTDIHSTNSPFGGLLGAGLLLRRRKPISIYSATLFFHPVWVHDQVLHRSVIPFERIR